MQDWPLTFIPAYGRDYTSKAALLADWNSGKDFMDARSGKYVNNQDCPEGQHTFRYANCRKFTMITIKKIGRVGVGI